MVTTRKIDNNSGRRKFLASIGIMGAAGICPIFASVIGSTELKEIQPALKAGPYLQITGPDEMTVRWITNMPCYCWVEYGNHPDGPFLKEEVMSDGLVEANNTNHIVSLRGIDTNLTYYYRICSKEILTFDPYKVVFGSIDVSPVYSFKPVSDRADKTSFLVFNDIHDRPESFKQLLQFQTSEKKNFIFLNGDIFNYMTGEDQIVQNLLQPFSGTSSGIPLVFSRGNHETRGKFARHLSSYFDHHEHGFYFSFVAGPVYCIVLDSGEDKPDDNPEYFGLVKFDPYRLAQRDWLKQEINNRAFKKAKYKIVFSHIPLFYSGEGHGTLHCREVWADILNEAKIDLLISGHTHVYGIHPKVEGQHNYPIVIGGGPKDGRRTIIEVNAGEHSLHLRLTDDSGELKGELML